MFQIEFEPGSQTNFMIIKIRSSTRLANIDVVEGDTHTDPHDIDTYHS